MKLNYLVTPLVTVAVAVIGSKITAYNMAWYATIRRPSWTPPGGVIGTVWTLIFVLSTVSALLVWNQIPHDSVRFFAITVLFVLNAALNVFWSYLFFGSHHLGGATFEAGLLGASVIALIVLIWPLNAWAAELLMPYAAWVCFATYLSSVIWRLNAPVQSVL
jgi:translocator protein